MTAMIKSPCDEALMQTLPPSAPCEQQVERWVLAATILGSSMAFIDGTVVNVALPVIQADLQATVAELQWVVEGYTLFLAALMLLGGSLGDHFGRRRVFAVGIVIFSMASLWSGIAPGAVQLILARAAQGIGGALLIPGSLALLSASFKPERRGQAIGTWSAFTAITTVLGPVLGGWMVENLSWRWVFFINIPISLITLAVLFWRVPENRPSGGGHTIDRWGAILATIGLGGLIFGLIEQANLGIDHPLVLVGLAGGTLALIAFVIAENRTAAAMMPLTLFRSPTFSGANLLTLLLYGALSGALFFLPFNLIQIQGYSPTQAGAALIPFSLVLFVLSRWAGTLVDRYGAKIPLIVGPAIAGIGFALFALPGRGGSYWTTFFPGIVVLSLGMAVTVAPLTTAVMGAVEAHNAGIASGINNAASRAAGLVAIAVMGIFVLGAFNRNLDNHLSNLDLSPDILRQIDAERVKLAGAEAPENLPVSLQAQLRQAIDDAFIAGYRLVMVIAAGMSLASAAIALLMIEPRKAQPTTG